MSAPTAAVRNGSRYGNAPLATHESACPVCGQPRPSSRAQYCSEACKQRAYRLRHARPVNAAGLAGELRRRGQLTARTIYECPACQERFLGQQRCDTCNRFCRSLGIGGACSDCDRLILLDELLGY